MIEKCESCGESFLTEADPYVVRPTSQGYKLYCYCHIKGFDEVKGKIGELEKQLDEAVKLLELFVENEAFMREVHPPKTIENSSVILSFDVYQQYFLQGKLVRNFLRKLEASKGEE